MLKIIIIFFFLSAEVLLVSFVYDGQICITLSLLFYVNSVCVIRIIGHFKCN